jgi:hypothetical protein
MKTTLLRSLILFLFLFGAIAIQSARAGGILGSELTYKCQNPNTYAVKLVLYYDCATAAPTTSATLSLASPGCNSGRKVPMTLKGSMTPGNPYCSFIPVRCDSTYPRPNYLEAVYEASVVFSAAELTCKDWILSFTDSSRATVANLVNSSAQQFYTEAYLNLTPGFNNNSPEFTAMGKTIAFIGVGIESNLLNFVSETECDSVSYELVPALQGNNNPVIYAPIPKPTTGYFLMNPNPIVPYCNSCNPPSPQFGYFAGTPITNFSPTYPLPSYNANWASGLQYVPVYQYFKFVSISGRLQFRPAVYMATRPSAGQNKYVAAIQVNEWRKVNNVFVKVGHIRRDMVLIVEDFGGVYIPEIANVQVNAKPFATDTIIDLQPGHNLQLTFNTNDIDTVDVVTLDSDVTTVLPGATFTQTSGSRPSGTINWTGALVNNCHQIRYFHIQAKDNACPVSTSRTYTYGVRVSSNTSGFKVAPATPSFSAFPNPSGKKVSFHIKTSGPVHTILIYNLLGREIDQIMLENGQEGEQTVKWENADKFPAGQYVARLLGSSHTQTLKFIRQP